MLRNKVLFMLLLLITAMSLVNPVYAQSTADLNLNDILDALKPRTGDELIWDIFLYLIFFLGFINVFIIPDKQMFATMLNLLVLGMAVVSKLLVGNGPSAILSPIDFPVLILNAGMFVIPLILAGMLRPVKGKPTKAVFPAILMGLLGGVYFFLFWALEQRGTGDFPF